MKRKGNMFMNPLDIDKSNKLENLMKFFSTGKADDKQLDDIDLGGLIDEDPTVSLYKYILNLEEFVINNYVSRVALISLLAKKNIISISEFNSLYEMMKKQPDIKVLYDNLEEKKKEIENMEDLFDE